MADPENQWGGGGLSKGVVTMEKKTVFEAFSGQYNPYFFIFVKEKWKCKISKGVAVVESPTGGSATVWQLFNATYVNYSWYKYKFNYLLTLFIGLSSFLLFLFKATSRFFLSYKKIYSNFW